mgnify:CR=1 FL=1
MDEEIKLEVVSNVDTKEIETALETTKKVDEAVVEKSLNYDVLTDDEKKAIDTFLEKIDVKNTTQILQFGASAQNNISKFSDTVLQDVRTRSTGEVGNLLSNLVGEIKEFDSDVPTEEKKGILGIFNSAKKQMEKLLAKYNKVENNIVYAISGIVYKSDYIGNLIDYKCFKYDKCIHSIFKINIDITEESIMYLKKYIDGNNIEIIGDSVARFITFENKNDKTTDYIEIWIPIK